MKRSHRLMLLPGVLVSVVASGAGLACGSKPAQSQLVERPRAVVESFPDPTGQSTSGIERKA